MRVSLSSPAQSRQVRQRLANPEESLSYELGKAVQELPPLYTRLLAGSISVLVFGTIAWAHFSKVDEVAVAQGQLIPSTEVRPIRSLGAGSIQQILVKEGATIKKGQMLVELDAKLPQTEIDRLEKSAQLIREDLARLEAERSGNRDAGTTLQDQLLSARLTDFERNQAAAIADANTQVAKIDEARVRLTRLQENLASARVSLKNAQEREQSLRSLVAGNVVPRLDYLDAKERVNDAQDKVVSLEKAIGEQAEQIRQAQETYTAAQNKATGLSAQRQSEILTKMKERREELASVVGQLQKAKQEREQETVVAPVDGTVYNVKATRGPVQAGEELLSVLPKGEDMLLEVKVLNRDIGFIREGMKAKVKLATFPYQEFGIVDGEVLRVSPNAIVEKDIGLVFPTKVRLRQQMIPVRGQPVELTPGMAATAEIVTRQKSILTFLIEPVTRRFSEAFSVR